MSAGQHTPGPWAVFFKSNSVGMSGDDVLGVGRGGDGERRGEGICSMWGSGDELLANARLIAAAPELLEAVRLVRQHAFLTKWPNDERVFDAINAAIAKAEGRS